MNFVAAVCSCSVKMEQHLDGNSDDDDVGEGDEGEESAEDEGDESVDNSNTQSGQ